MSHRMYNRRPVSRARRVHLFWTRTRFIKFFGPGPDLLNIFGPGPDKSKILDSDPGLRDGLYQSHLTSI